MANWKGTAVPNSGTIEKVYFNTNLSVEEVVEIISQLNFDYSSSDDFKDMVYILSTTTTATQLGANSLIVGKLTLEDNSIAYAIMYNEIPIFSTTSEAGFVGWSVDVTSPLEINAENTITYIEQAYGFDSQNDKLSSLFSITPFTQSEDKNILMHPKNEDGTVNKDVNLYPRTKVGNLLASNGSKFTMPNVAYKQSEWQGEVVPNSGTIENVYFNTNLSVEEVVSIIENLNFNMPGSNSTNNYVLLSNANYSYGIYINKSSDGIYYNIGLFTDTGCFWDNENGWKVFDNPQNTSSISLVSSLSDGTNSYQVGAENDKLSSLFSITPFEESSGGLFETNEDGTPNTDKPIQTGISEERVNELIDLKITGWLGGES